MTPIPLRPPPGVLLKHFMFMFATKSKDGDHSSFSEGSQLRWDGTERQQQHKLAAKAEL